MIGNLSLPREQVHVWEIELGLSPNDVAYLQSTLSQQELQTANRYTAQLHRDRSIVAHGALRNLLSRYTEQSPQDLHFTLSASGKPTLMGLGGDSHVHFNLSHSANRALIAIATGVPVGVDIERIDPSTDVLAVAERFFSSTELEALRAATPPAQLQQFFQIWVCKEAYVKARGEGILDRLSSFSVSVEPSAETHLIADSTDPLAPKTWRLSLLESPPSFTSAVAVPNKATQVLQRTWTPVFP